MPRTPEASASGPFLINKMTVDENKHPSSPRTKRARFPFSIALLSSIQSESTEKDRKEASPFSKITLRNKLHAWRRLPPLFLFSSMDSKASIKKSLNYETQPRERWIIHESDTIFKTDRLPVWIFVAILRLGWPFSSPRDECKCRRRRIDNGLRFSSR